MEELRGVWGTLFKKPCPVQGINGSPEIERAEAL